MRPITSILNLELAQHRPNELLAWLVSFRTWVEVGRANRRHSRSAGGVSGYGVCLSPNGVFWSYDLASTDWRRCSSSGAHAVSAVCGCCCIDKLAKDGSVR